jgi:hypothetical protein
MSVKSKRDLVRLAHLAGGAALTGCLYAPWGEHRAAMLVIRSILVVLLTLSGLWLWQGARLRAWVRRRGARLSSPRGSVPPQTAATPAASNSRP